MMSNDFTLFNELSNFQRWVLITLDENSARSIVHTAESLITGACMSAIKSGFNGELARNEINELKEKNLVRSEYSETSNQERYHIALDGSLLSKQVQNIVNNYIYDMEIQNFRSVVENDGYLLKAIEQIRNQNVPKQSINREFESEGVTNQKFNSVKDLALKYIDGFAKVFFMALDNLKT